MFDQEKQDRVRQFIRDTFGEGVDVDVRLAGGSLFISATIVDPAPPAPAFGAERGSTSPSLMTSEERRLAIERKKVELRQRFSPEELARHLGRRHTLESLAASEIDHESDEFGTPAPASAHVGAVAERQRLDRVQRALHVLCEIPADRLIARAIELGMVHGNGSADIGRCASDLVDRNEDLVVLAEREVLDVFTEQDLEAQARAFGISRSELVRKLALEHLRSAGVATRGADVCRGRA